MATNKTTQGTRFLYWLTLTIMFAVFALIVVQPAVA
jgi:hypothetical protein